MPQEMGPELYSELLRLSTEYKPDSKMLVYVAICVVSEAPSSSTASVKWERQLVSRCAKLKLCKNVDISINANPTVVIDSSAMMSTTNAATTAKSGADILILTFNLTSKIQNTTRNREMILANIQTVLRHRGVNIRRHYPEVFQRFMSFVEGTTERFTPVTIHPRDTNTGQAFICIIMPIMSDTDRIRLPETEESGNTVITIDCLTSGFIE